MTASRPWSMATAARAAIADVEMARATALPLGKKKPPSPQMDARFVSHQVRRFFPAYRKRDLNMIVSAFEFPEERQARLHFEEEGQDCSF